MAAREAEAFERYAEAFAARGDALEAGGDASLAVESWIEAALVHEEHTTHLEAAAGLYQQVLSVEPQHRRALFALGLVLHDLQRWDDLIALYRRRLESTEDEGERTTLHQYVAELLAEKKDDPDGGFEALMQAAARAPWNLRILSRLERLGERTGRLQEVAIAIGDMLIHQDEPRARAALSLRLGEMHLGPIDDPERALAYLRSALVDDGDNPEVLEEIEDFFRERSRFDELASFLEDAIEDRRIHPHRVRLERELARVYETELNDHERALQALTRALHLLPDDRELIDEVMRLGVAGGALASVAETYEAVAERTDNALLATYLRTKLGHLYASGLDDHDAARRSYEAILVRDPTHEEAQRRLKQLRGREARDRARAEAEANGESVLLTIDPDAETDAETASAPASGVHPVAEAEHWAEVLPLAPSRIEAVSEPPPMTPERVGLDELEAQLDALEGEERARGRLEVARAARGVGEVGRAEAILRAGLRERAEDREVWGALADLLESERRWVEWLEVEERRCALEPPRRVEYMLRMIEVARDELGDVELAWSLAESAAEMGAGDPRVFEAQIAVASVRDDPEALARLLEQQVSAAPTEVAPLLALGRAWHEADQPEAAARAYERAAALEPDDDELGWTLGGIWLDLDAPERARPHLERVAAQAPAPLAAKAHLRLSELDEEADPARARSSLERALELDENAEAMAIASRWAERDGDPARASGLAERCAELSADGPEKAAWFRQAARLADEEVGDARRAVRLYQLALAADADDPEVAARLGTLLAERGDPDAAAHLAGAAEGLRDEERAAELFEMAGRAAEAAGDPSAALAHYEQALARVPSRREALERAGIIAEQQGDLQLAHDRAAALVLHHEAGLSAEELVQVRLRLVAAKKAQGDLPSAARHARAAARVAPDDERVIEALGGVLEALQDVDAAKVLARLAARQAPGLSRGRALARAAAAVPPDTAVDRARRVAWLEEALSEAPDDVGIAEQLAEAREQDGDADGAADALVHGQARAESDAQRAALGRRAAEVVRVEDRERAKALLQEAVALDPEPNSVVELEVMFGFDGEPEARAELLAGRPEGRARASEVFETYLDAPERAVALRERRADPVAFDDLQYRAALAGHGDAAWAARAWTERCLESHPNVRDFTRLAELHTHAGHDAAARFTLEMRREIFRIALPAGVPEPGPLARASGFDFDAGELEPTEQALRSSLGAALLNGLKSELTTLNLRRRDALGPAQIPHTLTRALDAASRALQVELPPVFPNPAGSAALPLASGWVMGAPAVLVATEGPDDPTWLRFWAGRALHLLAAERGAMLHLPASLIRSALYGFAELDEPRVDEGARKQARKHGRAVSRALPSSERGPAQAQVQSWLRSPRRSLLTIAEAVDRSAARAGLVVSGSPAVAMEHAGRGTVDAARMLRFSLGLLSLAAPEAPPEANAS